MTAGPSSPPTPGSGAAAPRRGGRGRIPLPPAVLGRRGGRVLDPARADTYRDRPVLPTAYVANELLVQGGSKAAMDALVDAARETKHGITTGSQEPDDVERLGDAALGSLASRMWVRRRRLAPERDKGAPADAWEVLQRYRQNGGDAPQDYTVGLNHRVHLTAPEGGIEGNPLFDGPALEGSPLFDGPAYFEGNPLFIGTNPMFPAGLAPVGGQGAKRNAVPLVSVGALNPNGTVALFSNAGDWVSCHRPGAAVVSTFPVTFDSGLEPRRRTALGEDIDPDDFQSGFGLWSGTSFSAPYLAGQLAARMFSGGTLDSIDAKSAVARGWRAVKAEVGWSRP